MTFRSSSAREKSIGRPEVIGKHLSGPDYLRPCCFPPFISLSFFSLMFRFPPFYYSLLSPSSTFLPSHFLAPSDQANKVNDPDGCSPPPPHHQHPWHSDLAASGCATLPPAYPSPHVLMATINTLSRRNTNALWAALTPASGSAPSARATSPADTRWRVICSASQQGRRLPRHLPRRSLSRLSPSIYLLPPTARLHSAVWLQDTRASPLLSSHLKFPTSEALVLFVCVCGPVWYKKK